MERFNFKKNNGDVNPLVWTFFGIFVVVVMIITLVQIFGPRKRKHEMIMPKAIAYPQAKMSHADSVKWDSIKNVAKIKAASRRVIHHRGASKEQAIRMAQLFLRQRMPYSVVFDGKAEATESSQGFLVEQNFKSPDSEGMLQRYHFTITAIYAGGWEKATRNWSYLRLIIHNKQDGGDYVFNTPYGIDNN